MIPMSISPIYDAPDDVLSEIFKAYISRFEPQTDPLSRNNFFYTARCVCRQWRDIIDAHPSLWSNVCLDLDAAKDRPQAQRHSLAFSRWLERGKSAPLDIRLLCSCVPSLTRYVDLVKTVFLQSTRWRRVTMRITEGLLPSLMACDGKVPNLTRLELGVIGSGPGFRRKENPKGLSLREAPALKEVVMRTSTALLWPWIKDFPWSQIVQYEGDVTGHLLALAASARTLRHCSIASRGSSDKAEIETREGRFIVLPCLTDLTVVGNSLDSEAAITDLILAPALQSLSIQNCALAIRLIQQSSCSIRHLTFHNGSSLFAPGVRALLQAVPDLRTLDLANYTAKTVMPVLAADAAIIPNLEMLRISYQPYYPAEIKLFDMIDTRLRSNASLQHLILTRELIDRNGAWSKLKQWSVEGIRISIHDDVQPPKRRRQVQSIYELLDDVELSSHGLACAKFWDGVPRIYLY